MPVQHFIDVSNHQAGLDLAKLDSAAFIFKATEGKGWRDSAMPGFVAQARKLGKPVGFYHFVSQGNTPEQEAGNFLAYTAPHRKPGDLAVLDWEPPGSSPSPRDTDWARRWLGVVSAALGPGYPLWIYMNLSTANNGRWDGIAGRYPLWLAHYPLPNEADGYTPSGERGKATEPWQLAAWQFTDGGKLSGWSGRLDLNQLHLPWWPTEPKETPVTNRTIRGFKVSEDAYWSFLALEELAVLKGWCKRTLDIYQGTGYSSKSGGTHAPPGGAMDFWQSSNPRALLHAARNGGFPGWHRTPAQGFGHHVHAGTNLPGRPYSYQLTALKAGFNGLGSGGYGGKDDGPRDGVQFRNWKAGLEWLRAEIEKEKAEIEKEKAKQKAPATADAPAAPRAIQTLPDYWNPWLAVDAWDNANPADATLTGLSDVQLRELFIAHGFMFYNRGSLHEDMRFTLADFAAGLALENIPRNPDQVAWDLLQQITRPITGVTWIELRPVFDAAHAGGGFGTWGEQRTRHSVRAVQSGLNHLSGATLIPEDGIYSTVTRRAVANFQVQMRGATAGTPAADGVVGLHDALHLVRLCSERVGRPHRLRFVY